MTRSGDSAGSACPRGRGVAAAPASELPRVHPFRVGRKTHLLSEITIILATQTHSVRPKSISARLPPEGIKTFGSDCAKAASSRCPRTYSSQEHVGKCLGEQIGVIEMPKISGLESVVATNDPQEQSSERKGERIGVIALAKISYQESVQIIAQERISERIS